MEIDDEKIEDAVFALLWLTLHDERRIPTVTAVL
jgi:hypothetical protein